MPTTSSFHNIALLGKAKSAGFEDTLNAMLDYLQQRGDCKIWVENAHKDQIHSKASYQLIDKEQIGQQCDLAIVIGGDGSLLNAARILVDSGTPVLGINRGRLGFLTDIGPNDLQEKVGQVLDGEYITEQRFLLAVNVKRGGQSIGQATALNDCVLNSGDIARLIEFEIYINDRFVYSQRSDGLIAATPTGSTAYSLSGGGPIIQPWLNVMVLVPMFPHTLTSRPIVIDASSQVKLVIADNNDIYPMISCDGQTHINCAPGDEVHIDRLSKELNLIHPKGYDYYSVLRTKLGWGTKVQHLQG